MKKVFLILTASIIILLPSAVPRVEAAAPVDVTLVLDIGDGSSSLFVNRGAIKDIGTITINEGPGATIDITAAGDIRIWLPIGEPVVWDTTDTSIIVGGGAFGKVSPTVTYYDGLGTGRTVVIDVIENFVAGDEITISGLSIISYNVGGLNQRLNWATDTSTYSQNGVTAIISGNPSGVEAVLTDVLSPTITDPVKSEADVAYVLSFTLPQNGIILNNGQIVVTFPAGFDITAADVADDEVVGMDGDFAAGKAGQALTITRSNGTHAIGAAGGTDIIIPLTGIKNTAAAGNYTLGITTMYDTSQLAAGTTGTFAILSGPAAIVLSCESSGQAGAIWLRWTTPNYADGAYEAKYSSAAISQAVWDANNPAVVTDITQVWPVGIESSSQQQLVSGLSPNNRYYFAMTSTAEQGAESAVSNSPSCIIPAGAFGSIDRIAPTTQFILPASGSTVGAGSVVIKGTAEDTGGSSVQKVEISLDNGSTWHPAAIMSDDGTTKVWEFVITNASVGTLSVKARATDWTNNVETNGPTLTITVSDTETPTEPGASDIPSISTGSWIDQIQAAIATIQQQLIFLIQQLIAQLQAML